MAENTNTPDDPNDVTDPAAGTPSDQVAAAAGEVDFDLGIEAETIDLDALFDYLEQQHGEEAETTVGGGEAAASDADSSSPGAIVGAGDAVDFAIVFADVLAMPDPLRSPIDSDTDEGGV